MRIWLLVAILVIPAAQGVAFDISSPGPGAQVAVPFTIEGRLVESVDDPEPLGTVLIDDQPMDVYQGEAPPGALGVELQRAIIEYDGVQESAAPIPGQAAGIGPGSHLFISHSGSTYGCTANFVWRDHVNQKLYLGAAGHCFMPQDKQATHGPGKDFDASNVGVRVCVSGCSNGGQTGFIITGTLADLGDVVYARQHTSGSQVGHDFGLVEIPPKLYDQVRYDMAVWGGPYESGTIRLGTPVVLYGNAAGFGESYLTMARAGIGGSSNDDRWLATMPSMQGDSGSAVNLGKAEGADLVGDLAGGVLTHLSAGAQPGVVAGTTMERSIQMAKQAGLAIEPAFVGQDIPGFAPALPDAPGGVRAQATEEGIEVTWDPVDGALGYSLRGGVIAGGPYGEPVNTTETRVLVTGLEDGETYYLVVHAYNDVGQGPPSIEVFATVGSAEATGLEAPQGVLVFPGGASLDVDWDPVAGAEGYYVFFAEAGRPFTQAVRTHETAASIDALPAVPHRIAVAAFDTAGIGPTSTIRNGTPLAGSGYAVEVYENGYWLRADMQGARFTHTVESLPAGAQAVSLRAIDTGDLVAEHEISLQVQTISEADKDSSTRGIPAPLAVVAVAAALLLRTRARR